MIDIAAIKAACAELKADAGSTSDCSFTVTDRDMHVYFRPVGWGTDAPYVFGKGDTPEDCIASAKGQWAEMKARVQNEAIKKLALAIIRITHEAGCCTDAALRAEFNTQEIERHSEAAVLLANEMAENGPFKIMELAGANAA